MAFFSKTWINGASRPQTVLRSGTGAFPDQYVDFPLFWYSDGDGTGGLNPPAFQVAGTIAENETITIQALGLSSFGAGPTDFRFENFDGGALGTPVTDADSVFDESSAVAPAIRVADPGASNGIAADMFQLHVNPVERRGVASINKLFFTSREFFSSYSIKAPDKFTGDSGGNTGTDAAYSSDSSWKTGWALGDLSDNDGTAVNDIVTFSHVGNGVWHIAGNGTSVFYNSGANPTWWDWSDWNRMSVWIRADDTAPETNPGNFFWEVANSAGTESASENPVIFAGTKPQPPYQFEGFSLNGFADPQPAKVFTFQGEYADATARDAAVTSPVDGDYVRQLDTATWWFYGSPTPNDPTKLWIDSGKDNLSGANPSIDLLYDNFYLAWGPNAPARVEISNSPTFAGRPVICPPTSTSAWTSGSIECVVSGGGIDFGMDVYMRVILADNTVAYTEQVK